MTDLLEEYNHPVECGPNEWVFQWKHLPNHGFGCKLVGTCHKGCCTEDFFDTYECLGRKIMTDLLEQQLVNELRSIIQPINEKYKDFYHINLITLCDLKEMSCDGCKQNEVGQQCRRCVIGVKEVKKDE